MKGSTSARLWNDPCAVVIEAPANIGSAVVKKGENKIPTSNMMAKNDCYKLSLTKSAV